MYVGTVMRTELVTVPPDTTLLSAQNTLDAKKINHLLVVDRKGELLGICLLYTSDAADERG